MARRIIRRITAWAPIIALALAGCERAREAPTAQSRTDLPNIILITVESLRADHVGCYGYDRPTTPNIDALAGESVRFTDAHSATSWTLTSHASMFTGLYPSAHQVILPKDRLSDAYTTTAEILADAGYQCAAVVGGPYLRSTFNLTQGFAQRDESPAADTNEAAHKDVTNPRMAEAMERYLRDGRDGRPFFLFAYYWDVHYDYIPPAPYDTMFTPADAEPIDEVQFGPITTLGRDVSAAQLKYLVGQYDGEIRCTDEYLGRLWALLRELDLWDNTVIILTADHGEQFFEHGQLGHKHDLYAESLHVPLIMKLPRQTAGRVDDRLVNLVDLHPTILDFADQRPATACNGTSLLAEATPDDRTTFFELTTTWNLTDRQTGETIHESYEWHAVRDGRYKLLHVVGTDYWRLFDVSVDPREQDPLGAAHESTAVRLKQKLDQWLADMQSLSRLWGEGSKAQLSREEILRLQALGYLPS